MGYTLDATGKPTILPTPTQTVADIQAPADYAEKVGGLLKLTSSQRTSLTGGQTKPGWLISETDTKKLYLSTTDTPQGVAIFEDTGWITLTLLNSWANFGGAYATAQYRRRDGIVYVRGLIKNASSTNAAVGVLLANVPVGFRPAAAIQKVVWANGQAKQLDILANGNIVVGDTPISEARTNLDMEWIAEA